nr:glycosyl hydrolase 53 family protein [Paenibacillus pasadenensis]
MLLWTFAAPIAPSTTAWAEAEAPSVIQDTETGTGVGEFNYVGSWQSDYADHWSNSSGAYFEFKFDGTQIAIKGAKDWKHGIAAISIDGGTETSVDLYAAARETVTYFTSSVLAPGQHTVKVRVTGTKNNASSGTFIPVDSVSVTNDIPPQTFATVENSVYGTGSGQFEYTGSWQSGSSDHWSKTTDASFTFRFEGRAVELIGAKGPAHGIAEISIDGGAEVTVDLYAAARKTVTYFKSPDLAWGSHMVKVRVTGTKNNLATDTNVVVDKAKVNITPAAPEPVEYAPPVTDHRTLSFNNSWKFYRGNKPGAEAVDFDDFTWEDVTLPHSAMLEKADVSDSYQGISWYRRHFFVDGAYSGKKVFIEFEGVMQKADVYVNGNLLATHYGGYLPFTVDVTDAITYGGTDNIIAVKADNTNNADIPPGRGQDSLDFLYQGGIYRDVRMNIMNKLHITDPVYANKPGGGGVFVTSGNVSASSAAIQVKTHVLNETAASQTTQVLTTIVDKDNNVVAQNTSAAQALAAGSDVTITQSLTVNNPQLWSPDSPYLYKVHSVVLKDGQPVDSKTTNTGIRSIEFSHEGGLILNGQRFKGMGTNHHQAYPYLGNAVSNEGQYREAVKLKEAGFQYVRTSHYPVDPAFLAACDELGLMVLESISGWQYFGGETFQNRSYQEIRDMIRRDRNHPSIIAWEASLNESYMTETFAQNAVNIVHQEYPGGYAAGWQFGYLYDVFIGAAQHGIRNTDSTKPIIISEYGDWEFGGANSTSRVARADGEAAMLQQAANFQEALNLNRSKSWFTVDGQWVSIDYNNGFSVSPQQSGVYDLFRLPKFSKYLYESQRDPNLLIPGIDSGPMVKIANNWTSSSPTDVKVYSNAEQVELYVNGTKIATKSPDTDNKSVYLKHAPFTFSGVAFQAGTLMAKALIGGQVVATDTVKTPGAPARIELEMETSNKALTANGADAVFVYAKVVDANGTVVPTAANAITFSVAGPGRIVGDSSINANPANASAGIATALLQASRNAGAITVTATAAGLASGTASTTSVADQPDTIWPLKDAAKGADVGWLSQLESLGYKWVNDQGVEQDALQILKDSGVDSIRLRAFVNPPASSTFTQGGVTSYLGFADKASVVSMAKRASDLGFRIMLTLHYSDVWADPGKQYKPGAWSGHSFAQLKTAVYDYTYDLMNTLKQNGVDPEWVQVGNEINYGMIWPEGSTSNFNQLTQLINSGYDAIKAVNEKTKVIVHLSSGSDNTFSRNWFDQFVSNGGKMDVLGFSYYPFWIGGNNVQGLTNNLTDMAARYGKEVVVTEVGGHATDPVGTYKILEDTQKAIAKVPGGKGLGTFYWEPESAPEILPDNYPLGASKLVGEKKLQFTKALSAFKGVVTAAEIEDTATGTGDNQFQYVGTWSSSANDHWTNVSGSYFNFRFTGTEITLIGAKDPGHGIAAISIDGGPETMVDLYAPTRQIVPYFNSGPLAQGPHTVKVRVTNTKNSSSSNTYVVVDRAQVTY